MPLEALTRVNRPGKSAKMALSLFVPSVPFFRSFRYIHMQHHRFTNDKAKDPDIYVSTGPRWLLPWKWLSLDLNYLYFYLRPSVFLNRPKGERMELYWAVVFGAAGICGHYPCWLAGVLRFTVFDSVAIYGAVSGYRF
jgi:fatty acid desaturase